MNTILEFRNVEKTYEETTVVHPLSLRVEQGDFLCIVGTSGSGDNAIMMIVQ